MKQYVETFAKVYRLKTGIPFVTGMSGREAKSLKSLVDAIKTFWIEQGHALNDEQLCDALEHFLNGIDDDYILNRFVPSVILSSFNIIAISLYSKTIVKSKEVRFKNIQPTAEQLAEIEQIKRAYKNQKYE